MEIKQLKRFFFSLYFNPVLRRNSFTTSVLQKYIGGNLVQRIQHVYCILVTSHFGYVELRITRSIFSIPLDFEITRLTCTKKTFMLVHRTKKLLIMSTSVGSDILYFHMQTE